MSARQQWRVANNSTNYPMLTQRLLANLMYSVHMNTEVLKLLILSILITLVFLFLLLLFVDTEDELRDYQYRETLGPLNIPRPAEVLLKVSPPLPGLCPGPPGVLKIQKWSTDDLATPLLSSSSSPSLKKIWTRAEIKTPFIWLTM